MEIDNLVKRKDERRYIYSDGIQHKLYKINRLCL